MKKIAAYSFISPRSEMAQSKRVVAQEQDGSGLHLEVDMSCKDMRSTSDLSVLIVFVCE